MDRAGDLSPVTGSLARHAVHRCDEPVIVDFVVMGALLFGTGSPIVLSVRSITGIGLLSVSRSRWGFSVDGSYPSLCASLAESRECVNGAGLDYPWTIVTQRLSG